MNISLAARPMARWQVSTTMEALLATGATGLLYYALQGEVPYHDAWRFTSQVSDGAFIWDIAHILLQPTALLLHQWFSTDPASTLKLLSSFSAAAAVGLFHFLLLRLDVPRWQAVLGTLLLAGCCSVLTLAPSAHPKLVAFPFVNGALLCLCTAERRGMQSTKLLFFGGVLLALGAGFLASVLATAPFAVLAALFAARRSGVGWGVALRRAAIVAGACGLAFLFITCAGYVLLTGKALSLLALTGSVIGKADLRPAPIPPAVHLARVVFGTVNNLIAMPGLGATIQAWMRGQISSLQSYSGLLPLSVLWLLIFCLIFFIYLRTLLALLYHRCFLVPVAFLCGAQTWTIWYGLNDPEHWFQLTAPTIVLFLTVMPAIAIRTVLPVWAVVATVTNLTLLAVPVATYPLANYEMKLAQALGPKDLLVFFASYPGRPYAGFYTMPGVQTLRVDLRIQEPGAIVDDVLHSIDTDLERTLQAGGRVLVADILDPLDWEAPWITLLSQGVTKSRLEHTLLNSRIAQRLDDIGGIKLWSIKSSD